MQQSSQVVGYTGVPAHKRPKQYGWIYLRSLRLRRRLIFAGIVISAALVSSHAAQIYVIFCCTITGAILLAKESTRETLWLKIRQKLAEVLIVLTFVSGLYCLLQVYLGGHSFSASDDIAFHEIEVRLGEIQHIGKYFLDPPAYIKLGLIVLLVGLPCFSPVFDRWKVLQRYKRIEPWARRAYLTLVFLASFTLFTGNASSTIRTREIALKAKLDEIRTGFREYEQKIRQIATHEATWQLATHIQPSLNLDLWSRFQEASVEAKFRIETNPLAKYHPESFSFETRSHDFWLSYQELKSKLEHLPKTKSSSGANDELAGYSKKAISEANADADSYIDKASIGKHENFDKIIDAALDVANDNSVIKLVDSMLEKVSDLNVETFGLLYKPFIEQPIKEWVAQLIKKLRVALPGDTAYGMSVASRVEDFEKRVPFPPCNICTTDTARRSAKRVSAGILEADAEAKSFSASSDKELQASVERAYQKEKARFETEWKKSFAFPEEPRLHLAADEDFKTANAKLNKLQITDALPTLSTLNDRLFASSILEDRIMALLTIEGTTGPFGSALDGLSADAEFPLYSSKWGDTQVALQRAAEQRSFNTDDEKVQSALVRVVRKWLVVRRLQEYRWLTDGKYRNSLNYDRAFFDYCTNKDREMATLWGWTVKSTPEAEEYMREKHPEYISRIKQTGMIPQFGWLYYSESEGFSTKQEADDLFQSPTVSAFIGGVCDQLGHHG